MRLKVDGDIVPTVFEFWKTDTTAGSYDPRKFVEKRGMKNVDTGKKSPRLCNLVHGVTKSHNSTNKNMPIAK